MNPKAMPWSRLFLFCLGLFIASSFAMKWIEADIVFYSEPVSIFGLELFYTKEKIMMIFTGMNENAKKILSYHLHFDFIFMAGCFPGIACLCMMAAEKINRKAFRGILFGFAFLQLIAWVFDIIENIYLLKWLKYPVIGDEFGFYHAVVYSKWIIALTGVFFALAAYLYRLSRKKNAAG